MKKNPSIQSQTLTRDHRPTQLPPCMDHFGHGRVGSKPRMAKRRKMELEECMEA